MSTASRISLLLIACLLASADGARLPMAKALETMKFEANKPAMKEVIEAEPRQFNYKVRLLPWYNRNNVTEESCAEVHKMYVPAKCKKRFSRLLHCCRCLEEDPDAICPIPLCKEESRKIYRENVFKVLPGGQISVSFLAAFADYAITDTGGADEMIKAQRTHGSLIGLFVFAMLATDDADVKQAVKDAVSVENVTAASEKDEFRQEVLARMYPLINKKLFPDREPDLEKGPGWPWSANADDDEEKAVFMDAYGPAKTHEATAAIQRFLRQRFLASRAAFKSWCGG